MSEEQNSNADGVANETTAEYARAIRDVRNLLLKHDTRIAALVLLEYAVLTHQNLIAVGLLTAEKAAESFDAAKGRALEVVKSKPNICTMTVAQARGEVPLTPSTETKQ